MQLQDWSPHLAEMALIYLGISRELKPIITEMAHGGEPIRQQFP